ncbi:MAG: hypothetical protein LC720_07525 [Actinobacteria bacterium]|nr:hypothetical protein [Actinomycetota bacterium]
MRRLGPPTLLLACLVALLAPGAAQAARDQTVLFEAPRDLLDAQSRPGALRQLDALGVRALRVVLLWNNVAPSPDAATRPGFDATDPSAYHWGQYDDVLGAAKERGWQVLLTVSGPVPRWATAGGVDHVTRPDPQEFQAFMTAVGRRYGRQVKLFSIWNEPNEPIFLAPQFLKGAPASPRIYRGLFQAGVAGLRASGTFGGAKVLMGETAPRGTGHVVAPLTFLRGALCLDSHYRRASSCSALPVDGYAHHAYTTAAGPGFKPPGADDVTIDPVRRPRLPVGAGPSGSSGHQRRGRGRRREGRLPPPAERAHQLAGVLDRPLDLPARPALAGALDLPGRDRLRRAGDARLRLGGSPGGLSARPGRPTPEHPVNPCPEPGQQGARVGQSLACRPMPPPSPPPRQAGTSGDRSWSWTTSRRSRRSSPATSCAPGTRPGSPGTGSRRSSRSRPAGRTSSCST